MNRSLEEVRQEIDAIDDSIQDLIVRRTALVEHVRAIKKDWPIKVQPSREAEIIVRMLRRHRGSFPKRDLFAIWRQLITATLSFEGPFSVAVHVSEDEPGYWDLARDHFGLFSRMTRHGSVRSVIEAVYRQDATIGVLPMPRHDDPDPWWRHIVTNSPQAPRIIKRLPFFATDRYRGRELDALAICPVAVKPTGRDRSFFAAESERRVAMTQIKRAIDDAGLRTEFATSWRDDQNPRPWLYLVEVEGFVAPEDPRLDSFQQKLNRPLDRLIPLGGYAKPLSAAELAVTTDAETAPVDPPALPADEGAAAE